MTIRLRECRRECETEDRFCPRECWPEQYQHPEDCDVCDGFGDVDCTDPTCDCRVACGECGSDDVMFVVDRFCASVKCRNCGDVFDLGQRDLLAAQGLRTSMRPCADPVVAHRLPALAATMAPVVFP